jgi:hypothetical protein
MRQICIVGNSHVAALKMGLDTWQAERPIEDSTIDIFGSRARKMLRAQVHEGTVLPYPGRPEADWDFHSGTRSTLCLDAYDEIYFTVGTRRTDFPHFNPRFVLNFIDSQRPWRPLSQTLVARIVQHTVFEQWFSPLLEEMIRQSSRPVIHFLGCPFWSTQDRRSRALKAQMEKDAGTRESLALLLEQIATAVTSLETDRLKLPAPPRSVLDTHGAFTEQAFCADSMRLSEEFDRSHGPRDFRHMNAAYGREIIRNILRGAGSMTSSVISPASTTSSSPAKL